MPKDWQEYMDWVNGVSDDDNWEWQGPETAEEVKRLVAASIGDARVRRREALGQLRRYRVADMHYMIEHHLMPEFSPGLPRAEMI